MKNPRILLTVAALVLGVSACSDSSGVSPTAPRFNGSTLGTGHRADSTTVTTVSTSGTETTTDGGEVGRNGSTLGTGH